MTSPVNAVVISGATGTVDVDVPTPDAGGLIVTVNMTAYTSGHIVVTLSGIAADGSLTTLLTSASLGAVAVTRLQVSPSIGASANVAAQAIVPGAIRIAAVSSSLVGTYNVSVATVTGNGAFLGTLTAGTLTDGTATITGGVVTATELTDGTTTIESGTVSATVLETAAGTLVANATKVGFFSAAPVVQATEPTAVATTGATQTTPYGFTTSAQPAAIITAVNAIITILHNYGLTT